MSKFIKVTKGGESFVLLAANRRFYESQGWVITEPTTAEVLAAFPECAGMLAAEAAQEAAEAHEQAEVPQEEEQAAEADNEPVEAEGKPKRTYRRKSN